MTGELGRPRPERRVHQAAWHQYSPQWHSECPRASKACQVAPRESINDVNTMGYPAAVFAATALMSSCLLQEHNALCPGMRCHAKTCPLMVTILTGPKPRRCFHLRSMVFSHLFTSAECIRVRLTLTCYHVTIN